VLRTENGGSRSPDELDMSRGDVAEPSSALGSETQLLREWGREHLWMQGERANDLQAKDRYQIIVRGEGCYIYDIEGRRFIDGNSSGFVKSIGHGRPEIREAVAAQLSRLSHTPNSFGQATVPAIQLARKLAELTPEPLHRTFFCTGGSHAIEVAVQLARQWQQIRGQTRRFKIISRRPDYHGSTYATMSLGSRTDLNHNLFEPLMPGVVQVEAPNWLRCPWGHRDGGADGCCDLSITSLRQTIEGEGAHTIAALVATPFRVGGSLPPRDYWPQVKRLCDENGIVLIADEVTLGLGRLGSWLALERFGVVPDIVAFGKGLTSGELPAGAVMASREIAGAFDNAPRAVGKFNHGSTFGAHPVVMAAALENLRIIESERLLDNANLMGTHLYRRLVEIQERHPSIEYVSGGLGLLASLSIVRNRATRERYPGGTEGPALTRLAEAVRAGGLSLRISNTINISPPLTVTRALVDEIVDVLDRALSEMEQAFPPEASSGPSSPNPTAGLS
jgi:putrescine---pyruvate transaminase